MSAPEDGAKHPPFQSARRMQSVQREPFLLNLEKPQGNRQVIVRVVCRKVNLDYLFKDYINRHDSLDSWNLTNFCAICVNQLAKVWEF